ncbi:MAG: FAD-dependent oxidoreductase [Syntrophobacteraceae bacterium]|nr:FAD-dependent oxidoreductase [Syntrophobacteraceae bacterium]
MSAGKNRYVIVGGSAAGMAAAGAVRDLDSHGSITVFSDEPDAPYFRPLIPFLISGKKRASDMAMSGQGPYSGVGIEVKLNARVRAIDCRARAVCLEDGEHIPYDRLLIATGSRPRIPAEIEGASSEGVFAPRTLASARAIAARVENGRHAVMLGGGLLNLKVAFALLECDLKVTLVVRSPQVLSQLMEPEDAFLIRDALNRAGLKITTGAGARRILSGPGGVSGVLLEDGSEIGCELVCIGKGVEPNVGFDHETIRVDGGVVADRFTRSTAPDVYAAGDVAVTFDPITGGRIVTGLWTSAVEMGRCAGFNMAGRPTEYGGAFGILNATQVADVSFVSMGMVHTRGRDYETHVSGSPGAYRKLVFSPDGTKLVGVLLVGDISRAGLYRSVIRERMAVLGIKSHIINHTLHYGHFIA